MKLSNTTHRKFIETYKCKDKYIDTPSGKVKILEVHKTIPYRKYKIELKNGMSLEGAYNHVVIDDKNTDIYIKDSLNRILQTKNGNSKVINVTDLNIEENMYDISLDSIEEVYYSDGILSHNSGKSVSTAIYLSHTYIFNKEMNIGIVANKGGMAREFLSNTKNILIELPIWLQVGTVTWNKSFIEAENGMRILTDVPSSDSFRGFAISILVVDECAFLRPSIWIEFADSIFPSQSGLAFKKNILLSTANGMNFFHTLVKGARNKEVINNIDENDSIQLKNGEIITVREYYERQNINESD
jgi:hypothetical protein